MANVNTTRRALLGAATTALAYAGGAAIVGGAAAVASEAKGATIDAEWDRLYRDFQAAAARSRAAIEVYTKAETAHNLRLHELGDKPAKPASPPLDTSLSLATIIAQTDDPAYVKKWDHYEKRVAEWDARSKALKAETLDDAEKGWNLADNAAIAVAARVRAYPVSTLLMLSQKASALHDFFDGHLEAHDAAALVADICRLAGEAL
ncbi:hypothetical protein [Sphingomonas adhaesiva]|uniref:hypothetical protein n=1 Tax=Sphingomonas adhaesiva TaxID=28212 RepID=UPI002FFB4A6D